jgi:hypothetical protein
MAFFVMKLSFSSFVMMLIMLMAFVMLIMSFVMAMATTAVRMMMPKKRVEDNIAF